MMKKTFGFTIIEILLAIAIVSVLAIAVVLIINPAELRRESQDVNRISDLKTLEQAINFTIVSGALAASSFDYDGPNFSNDSCEGGANQRIFVSVPSDNGETPPDPPEGWVWQQVSKANLYSIDGNGWLPIDFSSEVESGISSIVRSLPVDPINTFASGLYYSYTCGSFELNAAMSSKKYQVKMLTNDKGNDDSLYEIGSDLLLSPARSTSTAGAPQAAPSVSSITPSNGINDGSVNITTVNGGNFINGATVKLTKSGQSNINGSGFSVINSTSISGGSFNINGTATGTWNVVVTNPDSQSGTLTNGFTVNTAQTSSSAPTVSSASPSSRGQGASNQTITVNGSDFTNPATSSFSGGGITVNSTTFINSSQLSVNMSVSSFATVSARDITVTNSDSQQGTCVGCFNVNDGPSPSSANPSSGVQGATGLSIAINGSNFVNGATVTVSGTGITINSTTFNSSSQITIGVDIGGSATTGARNITVTNPDSGVGTGTGVFTVTAQQQDTGYLFGSGSPTLGNSANWIAPDNWYGDEEPPSSASQVARASSTSSISPTTLFTGFNFGVSAGSSIDKICVQINNVSTPSSLSGTQKWNTALTWDGGTSFTTENTAASDITNTTLTGIEQYYKDQSTAPGTSDPSTTCTNWGRTWNSSEMSSSNFGVRVKATNSSASFREIRFDVVKVRVYYTPQ